MELIPGGSKIPVSCSRVQEYVRYGVCVCVCVCVVTLVIHSSMCRLYSMFMMVGCVQEELNALKQGLNDIIPNELLSSLTAEVSVCVCVCVRACTCVCVRVCSIG